MCVLLRQDVEGLRNQSRVRAARFHIAARSLLGLRVACVLTLAYANMCAVRIAFRSAARCVHKQGKATTRRPRVAFCVSPGEKRNARREIGQAMVVWWGFSYVFSSCARLVVRYIG